MTDDNDDRLDTMTVSSCDETNQPCCLRYCLCAIKFYFIRQLVLQAQNFPRTWKGELTCHSKFLQLTICTTGSNMTAGSTSASGELGIENRRSLRFDIPVSEHLIYSN
jgi:hypothetical protein